MKYVILVPVYNDRESLKLLIENINNEIKGLNSEISLVVINDASSQQIIDEYPNIENIHSIEIINMKENRGHTRCIASGLKYIYEKKEFDYVIPMDGDGEDRPVEIKSLVEKINENPSKQILKISKQIGYKGEIIWNNEMPDGTPRKKLDTTRINNLGWVATTDLDKGLELTIKEYEKII